MKKSFLALLMAGVLLICSCTSEKKNDTNVNDNTDANETFMANVSGESGIKGLLAGNVIDARNGEKVKLSDLGTNGDEKTEPYRYCEIDLDGDGSKETMVEFSEYGNTAIIHEFENELYAYMIPFRARQTVKADGEMMWSGGADYSGTYRAVFSGKEMELTTPLESKFDEDSHYINGEMVSFDEAMDAWDEFDAKDNADWFFVYELFEE